MKTPHKLGIATAAWAALACAMVALPARAADADVYSIERYLDPTGQAVNDDLSVSRPLQAGQKVMFKLRLLNRTELQTRMGNGAVTNKWDFYCLNGPANWADVVAAHDSGGDWLLALNQYFEAHEHPLQIGVWVNGNVKPATIESFDVPVGGFPYYTDMICSYLVENGDFALPLKLAVSAGGQGVEYGTSSLQSGYYLYNTSYWGIRNASNDVCNLWFNNNQSELSYAPYSDNKAYVDLVGAGIYIKTVDFDDTYSRKADGTFDPETDVWFEIPQNGTIGQEGRHGPVLSPGLATVNGRPVADNNDVKNLYVWVEDEALVKFPDNVSTTPYTFFDGTTHNVRCLRLDATYTNITFQLASPATATTGATTRVYLSSTPTNIYDEAQTRIPNFISRIVKVGPPDPPKVKVTINDSTTDSALFTPDGNGYVAELRIAPTAAFSNEFTVTLSPEMASGSGADPMAFIGVAESNGESEGYLKSALSVTFPANSTAARSLYVYASRTSADTADLANGIRFTPVIADPLADAFFTGNASARLRITSAPTVVSPTASDVTPVECNVDTVIQLRIDDLFGELTNGYTVMWIDNWVNSSDPPKSSYKQLAAGIVPDAESYLNVTNKYLSSGTKTSWFYVVNADGMASVPQKTVIEVSQARGIAIPTVNGAAYDYADPPVIAEGETIAAVFQFAPEAYEGATAYLFLVPQSPDASNCVAYASGSGGWETSRTEIRSNTGTATVMLKALDGFRPDDNFRPEFRVVLRTNKNIAQGEEIPQWSSDENLRFTFGVTNVAPVVKEIRSGTLRLNGTARLENGDVKLGVVPASRGVVVDVPVTFSIPSAGVVEPSARDLADTNRVFTTVWVWQYEDEEKMYGNPAGTNITHTFTTPGTNTVSVYMWDKDMDDYEYGATFDVVVSDAPAIAITADDGMLNLVEADGYGSGKNLTVSLGTLAPGPGNSVTVGLEVRATDPSWRGVLPRLNVQYVTFRNNETTTRAGAVTLTPSDGPGNFEIYASVTNGGSNVTYNVAWQDLYPANSDFKFSVQNQSPVVNYGMDPATNPAALNMPTLIPWSVEDVMADMTNGMSVTWNVDGAQAAQFTLDGLVSSVPYKNTYTNVFTDPGVHKVILTVTDKDNASTSWTYWYLVEQSKSLYLYPLGPHRSGLNSEYTKKYLSADGIGEGRVWADGTAPSTVAGFRQTWTYSPQKNDARVFAHGYRAGDVDNGTLTPATDYGLDSSGGWSETRADGFSDWYVYNPYDGRDSYFYCWILNAVDEGGAVTAARQGGILPEIGADANAETTIGLPKYEADNEDPYESRYVEAVFSKEYLTTDNVGDLNQDGIPDVFAARTWKGAGQTLFEFCQFDAANGGDLGSLMSKEHKNDDADYLPRKAHGASPLNGSDALVPDTEENWTTAGEPFTTILEIRGFHEGLNLRADSDPKQGPYTTGAWISDRNYSAAEHRAWTNAWETAVAAGFTGTPEEFELGKDGFGPWSPENRTDPTTADTDGDGLEDGYEYYFWYYAHVGWIDAAGEWRRLEGEKFNLADISKGIRMPPEEIERILNPNDPYGTGDGDATRRDSDEDGLTDLEELAIGTSPIHWDTDRDGISDLWEVLRGTDPLTPEAGEDAANTDGDYMAYAEVATNCTLLAVSNATSGAVSLYAVTNSGDGLLIGADGTFNAELAEGAVAIPVYRYGREASPLVPLNRGTWERKSITTLAGSEKKTVYEWACASNLPLQEEEIDWTGATSVAEVDDGEGNVTVETNFLVTVTTGQTLALVHDQVRAQFGFDPRTAWGMNDNGFVADRWDPVNCLKGWSGHLGKTKTGTYMGLAVNTKPYENEDEYLLLKYHYMTRPAGLPLDVKKNPKDGGDTTYSLARDVAAVQAEDDTLENIFLCGSTHCSTNAIWTKDAMSGEYVSTLVAHGADTDANGVPDGWEIYAGFNPSHNGANDTENRMDTDGTALCVAGNYAGTDSCNAYSNVESVVAFHPGARTRWYNKFWPTDPWNGDTDGDGIDDATEGSTWQATFKYGQNAASEEDNTTYTYTFVYGNPEDDGSLCIRGGGMNPCTADTDFDNLPDTWEMQYAGVIFSPAGRPVPASAAIGATEGAGTNGASVAATTIPESLVTRMRRSDRLGTDATAVDYYISGGMDATHGPRPDMGNKHTGDAFTSADYTDPRTGTVRNFDFDHDGLQNYQEYLTQTLRHLRYDDCETPLMGRSYVSAGNEKTGAFMPLAYMDGDECFKDVQAAGYPASSAWNFRELGYFAPPPRAWDPMANRGDHDASYNDVPEAGFRLMLPPRGLGSDGSRLQAAGYAGTDPRTWDTDGDGLDDYYEIFHGLNPLLGSAGAMTGDVISQIYGGMLTIAFWNNAWTGWPGPLGVPDWHDEATAYRYFDAVKYPWIVGAVDADADGDGIRNGEEALRVNITSPQPSHTDPTPLWMTDSSSEKSYTAQYYLWNFELDAYWTRKLDKDATADYTFAFEENEGYDTDGDGIPDNEEAQLTTSNLSDPLKFTDPDRRQAIWLPGENAAVISRDSQFYRGVGSVPADFLRQFTAEAWIRPEALDRQQTILERVASYGASTLSNNTARLRANFRIGLTADGRLYGAFDNSDAVATGSDGSSAFVYGTVPAADAWTHVALTFDGATLTLYVNGTPMPAVKTSLMPANGTMLLQQESNIGASFSESYVTMPCAFLIGASARTRQAIELGEKTAWSDFGSFYAGYVDEVRVWDGARALSQIKESMASRFSFADVAAQRDEVYAAWLNGATRNDNDAMPTLPAELVQHYSFQTLPGAVNAADVAWEPSGFTKNVVDNVRQNGYPIDGDIYCGWWKATPVHSTVYRNYRWVPWVRNTCSHLPLLDGSCLDSQYWSDWFSGVVFANETYADTPDYGTRKIVFPNTANPYPYSIHQGDRTAHRDSLAALQAIESGVKDQHDRYRFEMRGAFVGTTDLVPLGGAFAKRCVEMWDGEGAADAWATTGKDLDANGIPDWWEQVARKNYGASGTIAWDTLVTWPDANGREMTAREAYLRDLMEGIQPAAGGTRTVDPLFANRADADKDGLPDWFENLYAITEDGLADSDNDQLSNYAEYLIGECFANYDGFWRVEPNTPYTFAKSLDQAVPDYFLRVGSLYLGEMFADHDFMEDAWEDQYDPDSVSRFLYDAWADPDGDGWSNFAECRADTDPTRQNEAGTDGYVIPQHPLPAINATISYNGDATMDAPIVVQAYSKGRESAMPDAIWRIGGEGANERYIGYNPQTQISLTLGPGAVEPGSVKFQFRCVTWLGWANNVYTTHFIDDAAWISMVRDAPNVEDESKTGVLFAYGDTKNVVGSVNYETGETVVDLSKVVDPYRTTSDGNGWEEYYPDKAYVKVEWKGAVPTGNRKTVVVLRDPVAAVSGQSLGSVREGLNTFVAFLDTDKGGTWTPGEPYGVVSGVDVGWSGTAIDIELRDTTAQLARMNLRDGLATTDFSSASGLSDRGVVGAYYANMPVEYVGSNMPPVSAARVRIVRSLVNGEFARSGVDYGEVVFDGFYNLNVHPNLTEADLLAAGMLDLDWGTLGAAWARANTGNVTALTNVAYRLVLDDGTVESYTYNNNYPMLFVNAFERGNLGQQTPAVPVEPQGIVYAGQPTFKWTHSATNAVGRAIKEYPAFRLRVWTAASGGTLVYDSGALPAPSRDAAGAYTWTAPIYAGMLTPQGRVFATTNNYWWSVSMLDAKFTTPNTTETRQPFRLETSGALNRISDYGAIKACVRYFGPAKVGTGSLTNLIRVQAFTSPDFTGVPAGEAYVTNVAEIASISNLAVNATIIGLKPGSYYLRAFIDTDGDGRWSRWESWGYASYINAWDASMVRITRGQGLNGDDKTYAATMFPYTPRAYTVAVDSAVPKADIYIEDADTDNDLIPDAWEVTSAGAFNASGTKDVPNGNSFFTKVNPDLKATVAAYTRLGVASAAAHVPTTLMGVLDGEDPVALAVASKLLAASGPEAAVTDETAVRIDAFSLEDGIRLTVSSDVSAGTDGIFTVAASATVAVRLVAASTPDFADARETTVKTITIHANADAQRETISAEDVQAAIEAAGLGNAAFFKVKLVQE